MGSHRIRFWILILTFLLTPQLVLAADRYWVGGTGNWSDINRWSASSGGAGGASVPTSADNCIFDASSNTSNAAYTVTVNAVAACQDLKFLAKPGDGLGGTITWAGTSALTVSGSMTLLSGMSRTYTGAITLSATSAQTLTSNGVSLASAITLNGVGGIWQLADNLTTTGALTLTNGTLDLNGKTLSLGTFVSNNSNIRSIQSSLNGGKIRTTNTGTATVVDVTTSTNMTVDRSTGTWSIEIAGNTASTQTFAGGGRTWPSIVLMNTSSGVYHFTGSNTFKSLSVSNPPETLRFTAGTTTTIEDDNGFPSGTGTSNLVTVNSITAATHNLVKAGGGVIDSRWLSLTNSVASPASTWYAGASSTNVSGNSGWIFTSAPGMTTRYWVGGTGNWSDTNRWALTSGGTPGVTVPDVGDDVIFDSNSNSSNAAYTVTVNVGAAVRNLNFSSKPGNGLGGTITWTGTSALTVSGSMSLLSGMTSSYTGALTLTSAQTLTTNGVSLASAITLDGAGGTWLLADNFTTSGNLTLTSGTLDLNGRTLSSNKFSSSNSNVRRIQSSINGGVIRTTGTGSTTIFDVTTSTNMTVDRSTGTWSIEITASTPVSQTFAGGDLTWPAVTLSSTGISTYDFTGSNTFKSLSVSNPPETLKFTAGTTTTIEDDNGFPSGAGTDRLVTVSSVTAATHNLVKAGGGVIDSRYLSLTNSVAFPANTWYAGSSSTDAGGNSGWIFTTAAGPATRYWVGGTGNWSDPNHWALTSGGTPGASVPDGDDVIFDSNSNSSNAAYTVFTDIASMVRNLNFSSKPGDGLGGTITWAGSSALTVSGSMTLLSGMIRTYTGAITLTGTSVQTLTTNGVSLASNITLNGVGGTWQLADDLTTSGVTVALTLTNGTLDLNGKTLSSSTFVSNNSNVRKIQSSVNGGKIRTTSGSGVTIFDVTTGTNMTVDRSTGTWSIEVAGTTTNSQTFAGGGLVWPSVVFINTSSGVYHFTGSNTFKSLSISNPPETLRFTAGTTTTIEDDNGFPTGKGPSNLVTVNSITAATHNLVKAGGGVIDSRWLSLNNSVASPASTWYAGASSTNVGGNSGWIFSSFSPPSTRYWVGGTGNWSDPNRWALTSGGTPGATVPDGDDVIFDSNSNSSNAAYTVTVNAVSAVRNLNFSSKPGDGLGGTITWAGTSALTVSGSMTLLSGMSRTYTGAITLTATSAQTLTTNGVSLGSNITLNGVGGTWQLADNFTTTTGSLTFTNGTLDLNGKTLSSATFLSNNSNLRRIQSSLSGGKIRTTSLATATVFDVTTGTNMTVDRSTGTWSIEIAGNTTSTQTFAGGGLTWPSVVFTNTSSGVYHFTGSNTFKSLSVSSPPETLRFTAGTTTTIEDDNGFPSGTGPSNLVTVSSITAATHNLVKAGGGVVDSRWLSLTNSVASPASTWYAGASSTNAGGNSGWIFSSAPGMTTRYWVGGTGNWGDTNHWALTSGGTPGAGAPDVGDDAIFDSNSNSSNAAYIVTLDVAATVRNLNFSSKPGDGLGGTITWAGNSALTVSGSMTLLSGMSRTYSGSINLSATSAQTITTSGVSLASAINFIGVGGTWQLADNLTTTMNLTLMNGTLDLNGKTVSSNTFLSNNSNIRRIQSSANGGKIRTTSTGVTTVFDVTTGTNMTVDRTTGTWSIEIAGNNTISTQTFAGGDLIWPSLVISNTADGVYHFTGSNTFKSLSVSNPPEALRFTAGTTTTIEDDNGFPSGAHGGARVTVRSITAATHNLVKAGGGVIDSHFLSLTNSVASPANTWYAGASSTNAGGNSGWIFGSFSPPSTRYWVGGTGNWSDPNHWALTSGGTPGASMPDGDDVIFDSNSNASNAAYTVTTDAPLAVRDLKFLSNPGDGLGGTITWAGSAVLTVSGSMSLLSGMSRTYNGSINLSATSAQTITTSGVSLASDITFIGVGGIWQLADDLMTAGILQLVHGTLDLNGKTLSSDRFISSNSNLRGIQSSVNGGKIRTTSLATATVFDVNISTNLTVDRSTGAWSIEIAGNTTGTQTFLGGGLTWPSVVIMNALSGTYHFTGSNTFKSLSVSNPPETLKFTAGTTTTIEDNNGLPSGTAGNLVTITSITGAAHTLAKAGAGNVCQNYLAISNSTATPASTFYAANSTDGGGNSGWIFGACGGAPPPNKKGRQFMPFFR